jgi:hypothetical protein
MVMRPYLSIDELPSSVKWRQHRLSINMTLSSCRTLHSDEDGNLEIYEAPFTYPCSKHGTVNRVRYLLKVSV